MAVGPPWSADYVVVLASRFLLKSFPRPWFLHPLGIFACLPYNYLINCGSTVNTTVSGRVFLADNLGSLSLSAPNEVFANTSSNSLPDTYSAALYQTARVLTRFADFSFPVKKQGRHLLRLYFYPFLDEEYNLNAAKFSVSVQKITLLSDYKPQNASVVKEYFVNVSSDNIVLYFSPSSKSFAFINALEIVSLPDNLIPENASLVDDPHRTQILQNQVLETVARVNMGNQTVLPRNDTLWRYWVSDDMYLKHTNVAKFVSNISAVNYTRGSPSEDFAPRSVYGTATTLDSEMDPYSNANVTWLFAVDSDSSYLLRFHFCHVHVSSSTGSLYFSVYVNSWLVRTIDLGNVTSDVFGAPYYMDAVARIKDSRNLNVSVGPYTANNQFPAAILNGLEIMKMNNSGGGKTEVVLVAGITAGVVVFIGLLLSLFLLRRRRRKLAHVGQSEKEGEARFCYVEGKEVANGAVGFGYRFPFLAIQEATNNFNESLVIGVGGFGKVFKGVLKDGTQVAVKRGVPQSHQGLAEFQTEIEMLSQFRHRHLVSLIGYCNERDEMIIVYEYMENGTLKNHLYGSDLPKLSWRQRLEICIGSAKGLHYLHTGTARAIIHRDVKSANILLDENLMAKVADFGLSKTGPEIDKTHVSTAVKGSFGYLDPEYLIKQQLTEKSDIYSFGVVLFEVLCGRPVIDPSLPRERVNLVELAIKMRREGELDRIIDHHLVGAVRSDSLKKFVETAEKCLAENGVNRPSMGDVLWNLECALRLQGDEDKPNENEEHPLLGHEESHSITDVSTEQFSVGSAVDIAGVSMSKVFSEMVKADIR